MKLIAGFGTICLMLLEPGLGQPVSTQASQQGCDSRDLNRALGAFKARNSEYAKSLAQRLVSCPGAVGDGARLLLQRIRTRESNSRRYSEANTAIIRGNLDRACTLLLEILVSEPDYPGLANARIRSNCDPEKVRLRQEFGRANELQSEQRLEEALSVLTKIQGQAPEYPGLAEKLTEIRAALRQKQEARLGQDYRKAKQMISERRWDEARDLLLGIRSHQSEYRDVDALIGEVDVKLQTGGADFAASFTAAQDLFARNRLREARDAIRVALRAKPSDEKGLKLQSDILSAIQSQERPLVTALRSFYSGEYPRSETELRTFLDGGHPDHLRAVALFYVGACKVHQFYLAGEKDDALLRDAETMFVQLYRLSPGFQPPAGKTSVKVREVYARVAARSRKR